MKSCFTIAIALALLTPVGSIAQRTSPLDEGRRAANAAREAAIQAAFDAAQRRANDAKLAEAFDNWWDTPPGRWRYAEMQFEEFSEDLARFDTLRLQPWPAFYDAVRDRWTVDDFEDRVKDLEDASRGIIDYIEWQTDVEAGKPREAVIEAEVPVRLDAIQQLAIDVRPKISGVVTGEVLDARLFVEVLENLTALRILARSLRD